VQPQTGNENHHAYLEDLYVKKAMRLHCAFGHCSDKMMLRSLESTTFRIAICANIFAGSNAKHACSCLGIGNTVRKKSTVSHSETLPVASDNLPENSSNLDIVSQQ